MNIENIIKEANIKPTTARVKILELLQKSDKPLSYEDLKNSLSMDKATFYRNITTFEKANILNSFESNDKKRYFELKNSPHAHFVCEECNNIECLSNIDVNLSGYEIHNTIVSGKCKECTRNY
jgi:Fur family ferric uptake transcriptional regulator